MEQIKAVISGDLVASSTKGAAAIDAAMAALAETAGKLSFLTQDDTRFTRHRGDGWQIYVDFPGLALTCALAMATGLRASGAGIETRQAIGLGRVETLPAKTLGGAYGEAFELSGRALDMMGKSERLCLAVCPGQVQMLTNLQEALISLIDWQSARWSKEQAQAIHSVIVNDEFNNAEHAAQLGISRQAFEARLNTAGFFALAPSLHAFQSVEWEVLADA